MEVSSSIREVDRGLRAQSLAGVTLRLRGRKTGGSEGPYSYLAQFDSRDCERLQSASWCFFLLLAPRLFY